MTTDKATAPQCQCGRPAVCFGAHDGEEHWSCGKCCAHGVEDGWCILIVDMMESIQRAQREAADLRRQLEEKTREVETMARAFDGATKEAYRRSLTCVSGCPNQAADWQKPGGRKRAGKDGA